jgi:hypothetical protein
MPETLPADAVTIIVARNGSLAVVTRIVPGASAPMIMPAVPVIHAVSVIPIPVLVAPWTVGVAQWNDGTTAECRNQQCKRKKTFHLASLVQSEITQRLIVASAYSGL